MASPAFYLVYVSEDKEQVLEFLERANRESVYVAHYQDEDFNHELAQVTEQRLRETQAHLVIWATTTLLEKLTGKESNVRPELRDFIYKSLRYTRERKMVALAPTVPIDFLKIIRAAANGAVAASGTKGDSVTEVVEAVKDQITTVTLGFPDKGEVTPSHYDGAMKRVLSHLFTSVASSPKSPFVCYASVILTKEEVAQTAFSHELRTSATIRKLCSVIKIPHSKLIKTHFPAERDEWKLATWTDSAGKLCHRTFPDVIATISDSSARPLSVTDQLFDATCRRWAETQIKKFSGMIFIDVISLLLLKTVNPVFFDDLNSICENSEIRTVLLCPSNNQLDVWVNILQEDLSRRGFREDIARSIDLSVNLSFLGQNRIRELKYLFRSCIPQSASDPVLENRMKELLKGKK